MKKTLFILTVFLISLNTFGQCESFAKEIIDIIKFETYHKLDNYILPIEQQRKILHFKLFYQIFLGYFIKYDFLA